MKNKRASLVKSFVLCTIFGLMVYLLSPVKAFATPNLTFSDTYFNFGQIYQNQKVEHLFTFKNTGDQVLNIEKVKTSCGCTAAILSEKLIKPDESGEINITFNSGLRQGSQKKTIYVHSNDPVERIVQLIIEAFVKVDLEASPPRVYFNQAKAGQTVTQEVVLKNSGEKSIAIQSIDTTPSSFTVKIITEETKLPVSLKQKASLTITVAAEVPTNSPRVTGRVTIKTDSQTTPQVIIPITVAPVNISKTK